jgi:hypothetical protein
MTKGAKDTTRTTTDLDDTTIADDRPRDAVVALALHAARLQIAAVTATGKLVAGWAHAADRYVQALGDEVLRRIEGETASAEMVTSLATATRSHLHNVSALPGMAASHFTSQLARTPTTPGSQRSAGVDAAPLPHAADAA